MSFLSSLNIAGSALTAQRFRMDVVSQNIANADTTRTENGEPYSRKMVVMRERFSDMLDTQRNKVGQGVEISEVVEDDKSFKLVYEPDHPDADELGYVRYPNIDMVKEMMDMMSATRSYDANVTAVNAIKTMAMSALQIGR
ncbi:MAG: flagellar basal body rod protein FlgC [Oscillospiraceae bacterium]|jgi:flagellar basal-body rod protein FlgC|nr:flagellar basal body rod protein FlgC [Oscillospiraceae bacterium]